jgi:hypothetical protein
MKMEQTDCFETTVYKIQSPGNHPKESIQHSGHGESLKSGIFKFLESIKVKIKFTLEQAMKAHKGSRGIAVFFA